LEGGIASGFRTVKPDQYATRLFQVRRTKKSVRASQVKVEIKSLNDGDVFVMDMGLKIYTFIGKEANAFEKLKGGAIAHNLCAARQGRAKKMDPDDDFWKALGAKGPQDCPPPDHSEQAEEKSVDPENCTLFRVSDATGAVTFKQEAHGKISMSQFDSNDVFVLDAQVEIFVWLGKGASKAETSKAFALVDEYIKKEKDAASSKIPVTQIKEGQVNHVFAGCVKG